MKTRAVYYTGVYRAYLFLQDIKNFNPYMVTESHQDKSRVSRIQQIDNIRNRIQAAFWEDKGRISRIYGVYTDGSRTDSRVGAAADCGNVHKLKALPAEASIFTVEACAMQLAMSIIEEENRQDCIIFSDSLSVLKTLQASEPRHTMISALQHAMDAETKRGKNIQLCWIPGHSGIIGNDTADKKAKEAVLQQRAYFSVPYRDMYAVVERKVTEKWQEQWRGMRQKLFEVKPEPGGWVMQRRLKRREQVVVNRLRMGHTYITHGYLMDREAGGVPPICPYCQDAQLTVKHIVVVCDALAAQRRSSFTNYNEQSADLRKLLGEKSNVNEVINFLKVINIYESI